jgi:hypothetical protein
MFTVIMVTLLAAELILRLAINSCTCVFQSQLASELTDRIDYFNEVLANVSTDMTNALDAEIRSTVNKYR